VIVRYAQQRAVSCLYANRCFVTELRVRLIQRHAGGVAVPQKEAKGFSRFCTLVNVVSQSRLRWPGPYVVGMALLDLSDGRTLEYVVAGSPAGIPLVLHHGTPGAAVVYAPAGEVAARHGLHLVTYSRPGYGQSTAERGRIVADAASDVAAVLDALGAGPFLTIGWSGGGPHALACATLAGRCLGAALIGGVAPYGVAGLDWMAGMGAENVAEFNAALAGEAALTAFLREAAAGLATIKAADVAPALGDLLPAVDVAVLTEAYEDYLAESFRESVLGGVDGWRDDDLAFVHDWGVPLNTGVPVSIWQGDKDRMVPHSHGEWLTAHIPGSRLHRRPGEGHLSLFVNEFDAIVTDLAG
jgi:pimeloyl-ACP methyl ester carboxylesterase